MKGWATKKTLLGELKLYTLHSHCSTSRLGHNEIQGRRQVNEYIPVHIDQAIWFIDPVNADRLEHAKYIER